MTEMEFDQCIDKCYEELMDKQSKNFERFQLGTYEKFWLEGETRTLQFITEDIIKIEFNVVYIGSWSHKSNTWMWSWINESLLKETRNQTVLLKALKEKTGYELFEKIGFECDEEMAYELAGVAIHELNLMGYTESLEKEVIFI